MGTHYTFNKIAQLLDATIIGQTSTKTIEHLSIDSRKVVFPESAIFFALKGTNQDGHQYINAAYKKGVRHFIISEPNALETFPQTHGILVEDTVKALHTITRSHRLKFDYPIVGITGSNAKTIIKEWLYQLLSEELSVVRSPKSYNSQVGVPLSVWQMNENHQIALLEAGISEVGEMQKIAKIIQPTIGIFTNIGSAHSAGFKDITQKIREKLTLFENCSTLIYRKDHKAINEIIESETYNFKPIAWSLDKASPSPEIEYTTLGSISQKTQIKAKYKNTEIIISLPFQDAASIENALHCLSLILYLREQKRINNSLDFYSEKLLELRAMSMRLEQKEGVNNCMLIDDTYNADIEALKIALDFQTQQNRHLKNTLILTDILQSGQSDEHLYKSVSGLLAQKKLYRFIGIGKKMEKHQKLFETIATKQTFYATTQELLSKIGEENFEDECILFKGARSFQLEKIVNVLSQKLHRTILEIHLNAFANNLQIYKNQLKPKTKIMAMVKAFSYGAGTFEVANILQYHKVDYLSVAYTDEGVALRKAGITLPIMVLNVDEGTYDALFRCNLEPEIYAIHQLKSLSYFKQKISIHLNFDTGMNRLGFHENQIEEVLVFIENNEYLSIQSVFSHLVASDAKEHHDFTLQQLEQFKKITKKIETYLKRPILKHILNTAGIVNYADYQMDLVRLGLGLYGVDVTNQLNNQLQLVSSFKSYIAQIRKVKAGESIGYNRSGIVQKDSTIATVSIGYGDGLMRLAGQGNFAFKIHGKLAPIIGSVCMDMCMVDVTKIPQAQEGDEAIIFDDLASLNHLAKACKTISYEILTAISERVKRVYYQD